MIPWDERASEEARAWALGDPDLADLRGGRAVVDLVPAIERETDGRLVIPLSDIAPEPISWLWHGWLPRGMLVQLTGHPGLGKSTILADLAARLSRGDRWPDGTEAPQGRTLILSAEDDLRRVLAPRLKAAGAEMAAVTTSQLGPILPEMLTEFREIIEEAAPDLVIIDPLAAFWSAKKDSHRDTDVRTVLAALNAIAEEQNACIIFVQHWGKAATGEVMLRSLGSIAFVAAARISLAVAPHPEDETGEAKVLAVVKSNLARRPIPLRWRVEAAEVVSAVGRIETSRIAWCGETQVDLAEVGTAAQTKHADAEALIRLLLEDGPMLKQQVIAEGRKHGLSPSTMERAARKLGVIWMRDSAKRGLWKLPGSTEIDDF